MDKPKKKSKERHSHRSCSRLPLWDHQLASHDHWRSGYPYSYDPKSSEYYNYGASYQDYGASYKIYTQPTHEGLTHSPGEVQPPVTKPLPLTPTATQSKPLPPTATPSNQLEDIKELLQSAGRGYGRELTWGLPLWCGGWTKMCFSYAWLSR